MYVFSCYVLYNFIRARTPEKITAAFAAANGDPNE